MTEISKIQMAAALILAALLLWTLYGAFVSMSIKEPPYQVIETLENDVEIREYSDQIWATTVAEDQNGAFGRLFKYISGANEDERKIEMTSPVVTSGEDGEIFMAFVMPEGFDLEGTPRPLDDEVEIELVKGRMMAVIAFSGYATEDSRKRQLEILEETLEAQGIETSGDPVLMQYNDPWAPPFMRRNEVGLEVV